MCMLRRLVTVVWLRCSLSCLLQHLLLRHFLQHRSWSLPQLLRWLLLLLRVSIAYTVSVPATGIRIATSGGGTRVVRVDVPRRALEVPLTQELAPLARAPLVTSHNSSSHCFSASVSARPQTPRVLLVWLLLLNSLPRLHLLLPRQVSCLRGSWTLVLPFT